MRQYPYLSLAMLLAGSLSLSSCTTYKTNGNTQFDSVMLSGQEPVIHVGDIKETPDKLILLGWVDARISQPNWFSAEPTEYMANIILAEKGEELGADAIIYVSYKTAKTNILTRRIEARGQAVKLKDDAAQLEGITPRREIIIPDGLIVRPDSAPSATPATAATASQPDSAAGMPDAIPVLREPVSKRRQEPVLPTTVEEVMQIKTAETQRTHQPAVSLEQDIAMRDSQRQAILIENLSRQAQSCEADTHDLMEYERLMETTNYMLMNAEFLLQKARGQKNGDMESAATRLVQMLEQQREEMKKNKPLPAK